MTTQPCAPPFTAQAPADLYAIVMACSLAEVLRVAAEGEES